MVQFLDFAPLRSSGHPVFCGRSGGDVSLRERLDERARALCLSGGPGSHLLHGELPAAVRCSRRSVAFGSQGLRPAIGALLPGLGGGFPY